MSRQVSLLWFKIIYTIPKAFLNGFLGFRGSFSGLKHTNEYILVRRIVISQYIDSFTRFSSFHRQEADTLYNYYGGQFAMKVAAGVVNDGLSGLLLVVLLAAGLQLECGRRPKFLSIKYR